MSVSTSKRSSVRGLDGMDRRKRTIPITLKSWWSTFGNLNRRTILTTLVRTEHVFHKYLIWDVFAGKTANNDEALIDDLMHILKREVSSRKNKNTDILNLSSIICQKLSGKISWYQSMYFILIFNWCHCRTEVHQLQWRSGPELAVSQPGAGPAGGPGVRTAQLRLPVNPGRHQKVNLNINSTNTTKTTNCPV